MKLHKIPKPENNKTLSVLTLHIIYFPAESTDYRMEKTKQKNKSPMKTQIKNFLHISEYSTKTLSHTNYFHRIWNFCNSYNILKAQSMFHNISNIKIELYILSNYTITKQDINITLTNRKWINLHTLNNILKE